MLPSPALTGFSTASQMEIRRLQQQVHELQIQNEMQAQDALNEALLERRRADARWENEKQQLFQAAE